MPEQVMDTAAVAGSAPAPTLTLREAAVIIGISYSHVRTLARCGSLPVVRLGRVVRVRPETLDRWLADQEQPAA